MFVICSCSLLVKCSLLFVVCRLLFVVYCVLIVVCRFTFVVRCSLFAIRYERLFGVVVSFCCLMFVAC